LKTVGRHVTVGAGATVSAQIKQFPVDERSESACYRVAWLTTAGGGRLSDYIGCYYKGA